MFDNNSTETCYKVEDLLPIEDDANGEFVDFELKCESLIITDFSRLDREIVVKGDDFMLGNPKEKNKITSIDELIKKLYELVLKVHQCQRIIHPRIWDMYKSIGSYNETFFDDFRPELKEAFTPLIHQLVFDILFDKYLEDSPKLTLNDYCRNFINHDWDKSLYSRIKLKNFEVTFDFYLECYEVVLADISKDTMFLTKEVIKKIEKNTVLKNKCRKPNNVIHDYSAIYDYLNLIKKELAKRKNAAYNCIVDQIDREIEIRNSMTWNDVLRLGIDPDLYNNYIRTRNEPGKRDKKKPKHVWDYLYYNACPHLITSKQYRRNFVRDSNTSYH